MTRVESLKDRLLEIERELESLKVFRITPQLKKFQRQLNGELSFVKNEIAKLEFTKDYKQKERQERQILANRNRSEKMKRTWRYLKAIKENYPIDLSVKELRTALRKHRQGLETDISDVTWKNPSP